MAHRQYTLFLENRPGALARITQLLSKGGVNIEGISVAVTGDVGLVQLVLDPEATAQRILKRNQVPFTDQRISVVTLPNKRGALAAFTQRLAREGINLNYLYCTTCAECNGESRVILSGDDPDRIEAIWAEECRSQRPRKKTR